METLRKKPKIKICGITSREEAEYLNEANAEYAGFVLYEKSRRKVNFSLAAEAMEALKEGILKVAVVVDPSLALVREIEQQKFDIIQVHGTLCREVREGAKLPVFRAVNISDPTMWKAFTKEEIAAGGCIAGYVADGAGYGGGVGFDWKNLGEEVHMH
ncbi:N-(5'-phosphoribosyl)anthranilate isomerase [Lachnospiraceae bacterium]|nr:N-(5'-phosphoribosyl)anthranilate isomerase [Lachnospiraceae bacterium]